MITIYKYAFLPQNKVMLKIPSLGRPLCIGKHNGPYVWHVFEEIT